MTARIDAGESQMFEAEWQQEQSGAGRKLKVAEVKGETGYIQEIHACLKLPE